MVKLLKNSQMISKYLETLQINAGYLRLIFTVSLILFLCHIVACLWFLQAKMVDFDRLTWVTQRDI